MDIIITIFIVWILVFIICMCFKEARGDFYELYQSRPIIGMRWHGCYDKRIFINSPKDIAKINEHSSELVKILLS